MHLQKIGLLFLPVFAFSVSTLVDSVLSASFSADGQRIVTASVDRVALVWDVSGKLLAKLQQHEGGVNSARFSPDGERIVTASSDSTVCVWDLSRKLVTELHGHQGAVISTSFSPDGKLILTASADGILPKSPEKP